MDREEKEDSRETDRSLSRGGWSEATRRRIHRTPGSVLESPLAVRFHEHFRPRSADNVRKLSSRPPVAAADASNVTPAPASS